MTFKNPYSSGVEHEFWEMCVRRDLEAFFSNDWLMTAPDFDSEDFLGIHAHNSNKPNQWEPLYPNLDAYKKEFEKQASRFAGLRFSKDPKAEMYSALRISDPIINGDRAVVVKTFDGTLSLADGGHQILAWKSLFHFKNNSGRWQFTGFIGYLPLD